LDTLLDISLTNIGLFSAVFVAAENAMSISAAGPKPSKLVKSAEK
jgi:hypothetical protein